MAECLSGEPQGTVAGGAAVYRTPYTGETDLVFHELTG